MVGMCKLCRSHLPAKLFSSPGPEINLCHSTPGNNKHPLNLGLLMSPGSRVREGGQSGEQVGK